MRTPTAAAIEVSKPPRPQRRATIEAKFMKALTPDISRD
jgi:hypothetical protein